MPLTATSCGGAFADRQRCCESRRRTRWHGPRGQNRWRSRFLGSGARDRPHAAQTQGLRIISRHSARHGKKTPSTRSASTALERGRRKKSSISEWPEEATVSRPVGSLGIGFGDHTCRFLRRPQRWPTVDSGLQYTILVQEHPFNQKRPSTVRLMSNVDLPKVVAS